MPTLYLEPGSQESRVEQAISSEDAWSGQWCRVDGTSVLSGSSLDFVWAHTDPGSAVRRQAIVLSLLDHVEVLSWKNNLALLQRRLRQALPTEIIMGEDHFEAWCRCEFRRGSDRCQKRRRMWVVKDALANGGEHVWVVSAQNWRRVARVVRTHGAATEATEAAECGGVGPPRLYVVQQYIDQPKLWPLAADPRTHHQGSHNTAASAGRKFHWRVFGLVRGDLTSHLYPRGFAHVANAPWQASGEPVSAVAQPTSTHAQPEHDDGDGWGELYDRSVHVTNVSVNIKDDPDGSAGVFEPYPAVDFRDQPKLWTQLQEIMGTTVGAATPFMKAQRSEHDFALLGLDVMQDADGTAWLLEVNAPPSLAQCGLRLGAGAGASMDGAAAHAKDTACRPDWGAELVVRMMRDLIAQFVLPYLHYDADLPTLAGDWVKVESSEPYDAGTADDSDAYQDGNRNLLAWAAYKRALAREVCEAQTEDDRTIYKKQRTGAGEVDNVLEQAGLCGLTGVALKDALLAQHAGRFVHESSYQSNE
jgi:hypothetical protein